MCTDVIPIWCRLDWLLFDGEANYGLQRASDLALYPPRRLCIIVLVLALCRLCRSLKLALWIYGLRMLESQQLLLTIVILDCCLLLPWAIFLRRH